MSLTAFSENNGRGCARSIVELTKVTFLEAGAGTTPLTARPSARVTIVSIVNLSVVIQTPFFITCFSRALTDVEPEWLASNRINHPSPTIRQKSRPPSSSITL